ncbi:MAG: hypothetical protein HQL29_05795 [Candidatus Omnitrophica bacterium]|nr:hypothetical protein [Candidatus Omnitrophota bacterium]
MKKDKYFLIVVLTLFYCIFAINGSCEEEKNTIMKISSEVVEKIELPKGYHEGIYLENDKMLVNNGEGIDTWVIDVETGKLLDKIKPIDTFSEGIFKKNNSYYITDWDSKKLYEIKIVDNKMEEIRSVSFKPERPTGLVIVGDLTYVMTWERGMGTKYFINIVDENFKIIEKIRINDISEPSQICWDGEHFLISSWYGRKVYLVDPKNYRTLAYFKSPAKDTTGVFFDGAFYWVTGTYSDLYKMRIEKDLND